MITKTFIITDKDGIHARPAGELVKLAKSFSCEIKLKKGEKTGDCKGIFGIMGLSAKAGDEVEMIFNGEDEKQACEKLTEWMQQSVCK